MDITEVQTFKVFGNLPSVNNYLLKNRRKFIKAKRTLEFEEQFKKSLPPVTKKLLGPVKVHYKITFGSKRKRDLDNAIKVPQDCMKGIFFEDDDQIEFLSAEKFYEKKNENIEISVSPWVKEAEETKKEAEK